MGAQTRDPGILQSEARIQGGGSVDGRDLGIFHGVARGVVVARDGFVIVFDFHISNVLLEPYM